VRIFLTAQGRACRPQVERAAAQIDHLLKDLVTPEQLDTFLHVLGVLQNIPLGDS